MITLFLSLFAYSLLFSAGFCYLLYRLLKRHSQWMTKSRYVTIIVIYILLLILLSWTTTNEYVFRAAPTAIGPIVGCAVLMWLKRAQLR